MKHRPKQKRKRKQQLKYISVYTYIYIYMPVKYNNVDENLKDIKSKKHQKEVEERYNASPKLWDNVYKKTKRKLNK